jgi:enamine deaminase RidA (YjgF/YER057c/UK114 family)
MSAEKRLKELGIDLGTVSAPVANYVNAVRAGNLLFLAGKGPRAGKDGKRPRARSGVSTPWSRRTSMRAPSASTSSP